MTKYALPLVVVVLGVIVVTLHSYALDNFLYWHLPWLDVLMHFLGGLLVSLFGLWVAKKYFTSHKDISRNIFLIQIVLFVFIISLFWETSELIFDFVEIEDKSEYAVDTIIDFLMSTIGAFVGFYLLQISRAYNN